jgi:hypothetical protein
MVGNTISFKEQEREQETLPPPPPPAGAVVEIENMVEIVRTLVHTLRDLNICLSTLEEEVKKLKEEERQRHHHDS